MESTERLASSPRTKGERYLREVVFDVGAVFSHFEIGELERIVSYGGYIGPKRAKLTDKKAAGRCSSAQNRRGVSRVTE